MVQGCFRAEQILTVISYELSVPVYSGVFFMVEKPIGGRVTVKTWCTLRNSLVVQWLRPHTSTGWGTGLIPDEETRIPHATQPKIIK